MMQGKDMLGMEVVLDSSVSLYPTINGKGTQRMVRSGDRC